MKAIVAGPYIGEFGWELMEFQGHVRALAVDADKVIVCSTKGLEALYADFHPAFLPHEIEGLRDCHEMNPCRTPAKLEAARRDLRQRADRLRNQGYEVYEVAPKASVTFKNQKFVKYGSAERANARGDVYDIVLHARNKESNDPYYRVYNWPLSKWNDFAVALMDEGYKLAAIGLKEYALLPKGVADLRDIDLTRLMNLLAASRLVVGPSSGPMHLAGLCGAPHFVWTGRQWSSALKAYNRERYETRWNPLKTPCYVIDDKPDVDVDTALKGVHTALSRFADTKQVIQPARTAARMAARITAYWAKRSKRQGKDYVSKDGRGSEQQMQVIVPLLEEAMSTRSFALGLDFGCGWGRFVPTLLKRCERLHAVDLIDVFDPEERRNVEFQQIGYPTKLDLPDGSVDMLWVGLVFQHITSDEWLADVITEIRRVLADGALVVILDDNNRLAPHVKQRKAGDFIEMLGLHRVSHQNVSLDGLNTHHLIVGTHHDPGADVVNIGVLCYEGFDDLVRCVKAIQTRTKYPFRLVVFDNSERDKKIKGWLHKHYPETLYLTSGKNVGCTRSRNIMFHTLLKMYPEMQYLVIMDQDIEVQSGWLNDMINTMTAHADCGIVAWPQAYRLKRAPVGNLVSEVASMCNLHLVEPLLEVEQRWGEPFDERFFFHKFDSLICQRLNQLGWRTRLVMKYYRKRVQWQRQTGGIVHHHPHRGIRRHPRWQHIVSNSKKLYAGIQRDEKWREWYPGMPVSTLGGEMRVRAATPQVRLRKRKSRRTLQTRLQQTQQLRQWKRREEEAARRREKPEPPKLPPRQPLRERLLELRRQRRLKRRQRAR